MTEANLSQALEEWKRRLGSEQARSDPETLDRYARATEPSQNRPPAVLFPTRIEQIQALLEVANRYSVLLYPISRGRNWGYGSACPAKEGGVVVDLSRMDRILEVNEKLAYAVVEPGVSQQQLYDYLEQHRIPLCLDVTGAPPSASLLGNILERGYGQTPYSDHFLNSCGMEVVLPDGRILRTGFGRFPEAKATYLYKWGMGPYLEGIFSQSNFGIVTKIGVWLMPRPECFGLFSFQLPDDERLGEVVERLRDLKLRDVLSSAVHLFNDMRVLSSLQQYPWEEAQGKVPVPEVVRLRLLRKWRLLAWNCGGGLRGSRRRVRMEFEEVRKVLWGVARVEFIPEERIRWISRFSGLYRWAAGFDPMPFVSFSGLMRGIPTERPTLIGYWRKKTPPPPGNYDLARDRCGLIWCAPVIPSTGEDARQVVRLTRTLCTRYGFETNASMTLITPRAISCVVGILYDRDDPDQTSKAQECYEHLLAQYHEHGYVPYRLSSYAIPSFLKPEDPFRQVCREIKQALDPKGILAPGRYGIG